MFRVDVAATAVCFVVLATVAAAETSGPSFSDPKSLNTNATSDAGSDLNPSIAGDGDGNYVVVWESTDSLGGTIDGDSDVLFARSSDGGTTWSAPAPLAAYARNDNSHDATPTIATDGKGIWAVTWRSNHSLGETIGDDVDVLIAYSNDRGATWTAPTPLYAGASEDELSESRISLATDDKGNWGASFAGAPLEPSPGTPVQRNIYTTFRKKGASTWSDPARLNPVLPPQPINDHTSPSIAVDAENNWVVVWRRIVGRVKADIFAARSTDGGKSWTAAATVNTAVGATSRNYGSIVETDGKNWVTLWVSAYPDGDRLGKDQDIVFSSSTDGGKSWSKTRELNSDAPHDVRSSRDELPAIATGGGGWLVVWSREDDTGTHGKDNDLRAALSRDGIAWSQPLTVNNDEATDDSHDLGADVAGDAAGNWVVVWSRRTNIPSQYGTDADLFFSIAGGAPPSAKESVDIARR